MYDTSTANPINPQGTVGGGNVFSVGPLFGNILGQSTSSNGNNPATTTNKDTAALGGGVTSSDVPAPSAMGDAVTNFFTANKTLILLGSALLGVLWFAGKMFRKSK